MAGLDQRERTIANMIDEAKRNHDEAAQKLQAYEQKLAAAAVEAHGVLVQARRDAAAAGEKMLEAARVDANRERLRARTSGAKDTAVSKSPTSERLLRPAS
jgi:F-type H+-transporting ATPase subunit b